jgi:2-iminoacetate synthase ThiH
MLFGHIETPEEIIDHLSRLRSLQDRTGGFQAFCPLPFHAGGTRIGVTRGPGGYSIARIVTLARIFLDNLPHIRVLANFLDRRLPQVLLFSGADDVGGTSIDEQIARSAGAPEDSVFHSPDELEAFIQELGLTPALTSSIYNTASVCSPWRAPRRAELCREILREAMAGRRLTGEEAVQLHDSLPFYELGYAAHQRRRQIVGSEYSTFIVDRNISFTNICTVGCKFCAFHRSRNDSDSFLMSIEEIVRRVEEAAKLGAT